MTPLPVLSCDNCGACCTHIGTPPGFAMFFGTWSEKDLREMPDWPIIQQMPAVLKDELREYYHAALVDGTTPDRSEMEIPCLWYDEETRRCRHYEHRPMTCRNFQVGCSDCLNHRKRVGVT